MNEENVTPEQMQEFFDFLQGKTEDEVRGSPKLTKKKAFSVIYYLQEKLHVLPDNFEMCFECKSLFDTHQGGITVDSDGKIDEFYERLGVTKKLLKKHEGKQFCCDECESVFWNNL